MAHASCAVQEPEKAIEEFAAALCVWLEKEVTAGAPRDDSCESIDSDTSSRAPPASFIVTFRRFLDLIRFAVIELQLHETVAVSGEDTFPLTAHLTAVRFANMLPLLSSNCIFQSWN